MRKKTVINYAKILIKSKTNTPVEGIIMKHTPFLRARSGHNLNAQTRTKYSNEV